MVERIDPFGEEHYGFFSPHWMLKVAIMYVPASQLRRAVIELINYMVYTDEWHVGDALDVLAQYALTGQYIRPHDEDFPMSDTDIEDAVARIMRDVDAKLGPDGEEPPARKPTEDS